MDITFDKLVLNTSEIEKFTKFTQMYENGKNKMCIDRDNKQMDDILLIDAIDRYNNTTYIIDEIYYIHNNYNILSFAVIYSEIINVIVLDILCSNSTLKLKYKGYPLGIYLLNAIYSDYSNTHIIKIHPANDNVKSYYVNWKPPLLVDDTYYNTGRYLIYGNVDNITEYNLWDIFLNDKLSIVFIQNYVTNDNIIGNTPEDKKLFLYNKIKEIKDENIKSRAILYINNIKIFELNDIYRYIRPKILGGGNPANPEETALIHAEENPTNAAAVKHICFHLLGNIYSPTTPSRSLLSPALLSTYQRNGPIRIVVHSPGPMVQHVI